jgi:hypothetical protein
MVLAVLCFSEHGLFILSSNIDIIVQKHTNHIFRTNTESFYTLDLSMIFVYYTMMLKDSSISNRFNVQDMDAAERNSIYVPELAMEYGAGWSSLKKSWKQLKYCLKEIMTRPKY